MSDDMTKAPAISAIICTHNRADYLGLAIDSLLAQDYDDFDVIVVDNASTDGTRAVVEARLGTELGQRLTYIYEATLGLSQARNRGAQDSQGAIIAYLDDDAIAQPSWLSELMAAYAVNDKLAIAGGKVTLIWPEDHHQPSWLSGDLMSGLGAYDLGRELKLIEKPGQTPRGVNYSLRRSFLDAVGGFNLHLGRVGNQLLSNEELYMTELALDRGWEVAYLPKALVAHHVSVERMQRDWFLKRSWWQGVSESYREQLAGRAQGRQLLYGGERFVRGIYKAAKYVRDPALSFDNLTYAYGQIGYLQTAIAGMFRGPVQER
jgi:glycosyltransferase involved in cell wall biosynthesis